jgi:cytochrome c peroxidase
MSIFSIRALNKELMLCQEGALREAPLRCWRRAFIVAGMIALIFLASACSAIREEIEQPPASSASQVHFTDVTEEVGLDFQHGAFRWEVSGDAVAMMGGGLCWLDYNKDGWLDLYVVNSYAVEEAGRWEAEGGLPRNALYRNDNGHFSDVSSSSGTDLQMRGNGCVAADFNLDGWTDLYITTARVNTLLWNNGDGTFTQGEEAAGVDIYGWQTGAAVGDINADGLPDLFVAGYVDINNRKPEATQGFPNTHIGRRDQLFINEGVGENGFATFREVGVTAGLENSNFEYGLGALLSDLDRDGDLDLLVANDTNPNRLYENVAWPGGSEADPEGLGFRFAEVGQYANIGDRNSGMGVASGDFNNDGRFDLMITNLGDQLHSMYVNRSAAKNLNFEEATSLIGLPQLGAGWTGWGIAWADVDLDTDLDLIVANGTVPVLDPPDDVQKIQFFANLTAQGMEGIFQDLTNSAGFNEIEPLLARGSAVADFDNDGDLDIAISSIGNRLVLLRNEQPQGQWLSVALQSLIPGALVVAVLPDGQELYCETRAGSSYLSSEDPRCHFGLGDAEKVSRLEIHWPDGNRTELENLLPNQLVSVGKKNEQPAAAETDHVLQEEVFFQINLKAGGARPLEILPAASEEMIRLGEALFWDKELSGNRDVACATCHHPLAGTGDDLSLSIGVGGSGFGSERQIGQGRTHIPRNAPEIFNRGAEGWHTMFWDGRVAEAPPGSGNSLGFLSPAGDTLPQGLNNVVAVQAMFPVTSRDEMRGDEGDVDQFGQSNELALFNDKDLPAIWNAIMERLLQIPEYKELFAAAYPNVPLSWLRFQHAANAIASYEMSVFTYADSPWDRFLAGDANALSSEAKRGAFLFYGDAGCSHCHNGSLLTDQSYHNIGVPQLGPGKGDEAPLDYGRGRETGLAKDRYAFRTPPLRNVALSGPWMHNGAYTSLEGAVRHHLDPATAVETYDISQLDPGLRGTYQEQPAVLSTLDPLVATPLVLSDRQVNDLLAFLEALTSPTTANSCELIPESVPSGLPIDRDPTTHCR